MATDIDIKALLTAGAHFGHKTSRWHPKMAQYIHSQRGGAHIIDLTKTVEKLEPALKFLSETTASGKQVLFVATKRQAKDIATKAAEASDMPFVTERWLGGMLTNHKTVFTRVKRLKDLEEKMASGDLAARYSKLEVQRFQEEIDSLNITFGGIKNLAGLPGALFIFDLINDEIAVREARKLGIPVVALVDTNGDPSLADYPVPCNDDALAALQLMSDYAVAAINAGKAKRKAQPDKDEKSVATEESAKPTEAVRGGEA